MHDEIPNHTKRRGVPGGQFLKFIDTSSSVRECPSLIFERADNFDRAEQDIILEQSEILFSSEIFLFSSC